MVNLRPAQQALKSICITGIEIEAQQPLLECFILRVVVVLAFE